MKKFFIILSILIVVTVMEGCLNSASVFPILNVAPIIISEPIITATEDQLYLYQVEASDPNGDILAYSSIIKPEGMNINSENGLIVWTPTNDQVGINQVVVEISDGKHSVTQSFEIEVSNVNNPPQILSYFPGSLNVVVNEGESIKFEVQAHDIDLNTTLSYQWFLNGKLVLDSTVSGDGSKSSWIYSASYGDYSQKIVKILVSDGELEGYIQWNITINDITPPAQPTLDTVLSPTNVSPQTLSGTKESNTSIWINGVEVISVNSDTTWSYSYNLSEGENNISIISKDTVGNESNEIYATIILDISAPTIPGLNIITSPTNISPQILSGTKEINSSILINGAEVISLNSSTNWSYSYNLSEGTNNISIASRDAAGNESSAVTATIEYDLNIYVDKGNTSGIEDGTQTHPFSSITEGIEAVASGKSVMVAAETYNEQLIINKEITLQGDGEGSKLITGTGFTGNLITVTADDVTISGFTIDGKSGTDIGIYSDSSSSIEISENLIQNHQDSGIFYHRASDDCPSGIYVYNNEICQNSINGIKVTGAGSGIIESNIIRNSDCGIKASNDASLEVKKNNIYNNYDSGIFCRNNSSLLIWDNEITSNGYGIRVGEQYSDSTNPDIGGGDRGGIGKNNIFGNTTTLHGVSNMTDHNIFAKYNWWGDAAGPKYPNNPDGNTDLLSDWAYWDNVNNEDGVIIFEDYLTEPQTL
ncbi:hypothetical protein ES705_28758 [subsurface metagenome]